MIATTEKVVAWAGKVRALQCIKKYRTRTYEFAIKNDTQKSTPLRLDIIVMETWAILTPDENTAFFSDVTPCSWVEISQRF
jgi:hypothetical protein